MLLAESQRFSLARELHDTVLQEFLVIVMQLRRIEDKPTPSSIPERVDFSLQAAARGIERVRGLLGDLRASPNTEAPAAPTASLFEEVSFALDAVLEPAALRRTLRCPDALFLPTRIQSELVNVLREAATNVVRHARARSVDCTIVSRESALEVTLQDDGRGLLDTEKAGYGLTGMRERAELIGATINIGSGPRRGTTVFLTLPITHSLQKHIASARHHRQAEMQTSNGREGACDALFA